MYYNKGNILKKYYGWSVIKHDDSKYICGLEAEGLLRTKIAHDCGKLVTCA